MSCDNGGTSVGLNGKPEYQYKIGNRIVTLDTDTASRLKKQEQNGILDKWWYTDESAKVNKKRSTEST